MVLLTPSWFPGIGEEEKITVSPGISLICLWVPDATLDRAASGSPWEPVHNNVNSLG